MAADEENVGFYYPNAFFYQQSIKSGGSLIWNDSYYGGFPYFLDLFVGNLYPLHYLLFNFLPFFTAYHLAIFIPAFLGVLFAYLFARRQDISQIGSLVAALGYLTAETFGGFNTGLSYANGFMVLPWLALAVLNLKISKGFWPAAGHIAFGGVGAVIGFLAGFPQIVLYGLAFVFIYALFLDPYRWKAVWGLMAMVTIGVLVAAPQLIPTFLFLDETLRVPGYTATISDNLSGGVLLNFLLPYHLKVPRVSEGGAGLYIGILPLMLAFIAMLFWRTKTIVFLTATYVFIFLMGLHVPIISLINDYLPIFSRISGVARWFLVGSFILSLLAGYGYDYLVANHKVLQSKRGFRSLVRFFEIVSVVIIISAILGNLLLWQLTENEEWREMTLQFLIKGKSLKLPVMHYQNVFNQMIGSAREDFSLLNWRFFLSIFLIPISVDLLKKKFFKWGFLIIVTVNVIVVFWSSFAEELVNQKLLEKEPAVVSAIKKNEDDLSSFRTVTFVGDKIFQEFSLKRKLSTDERALISREILANQVGAMYGLKTIGGFEPLRTQKQSQIIDKMIVSGKILENLDRLSIMGVKYVIALEPLNDARLEPVLIEQNKDLPLTIYLYKNKEVLPLVYFINRQDSEGGRWLIFSQTKAPGWVAEIDGRPTRIYTANDLFQAIYVPAGRQEIKFIYKIFP